MYKYCTTHLLHKARHSSYLLLVKLMLSHQISIQRFLLMVLFVVQMLFKLFQEQWCVTSLLCLQLLKPKRRPLFYGWLHVTGAEKEEKKGGLFLLPPALYLHFSFPHAWSERCSPTKRQWHASARSYVQHQTALLMPRTLSSTSEVGLSWAIFCKQESTKLRK